MFLQSFYRRFSGRFPYIISILNNMKKNESLFLNCIEKRFWKSCRKKKAFNLEIIT